MRRILSAAGWLVVGMLVMPVLSLCIDRASARLSDSQPAQSEVSQEEDVDESETCIAVEAPRLVSEQDLQPVAVVAEASELELSESVAEEPSLPSADLELQDMPLAQSQNGDGLRIVVPESADEEPFSFDSETRRRDFGFEEPGAPPKTPAMVLPVATDSLATDASLDEAGLAKVKELRETLRKVVEEKAAKLSAKALEAEIQLHQRHLSDLNALEDLLRLEQGLKELGDKFPESDSGVKAKELLKALEHLRNPIFPPDVPIRRKSSAIPLTPINPETSRSDLRRSRLTPFAYDQMNFKWLRGIVDFDAATGQWVIFYNNRPAAADPYRGRLKLHAHDGFSKVKPGDVVLLEGNLDSLARDSQGKPVYKVHYVTQLKPKR